MSGALQQGGGAQSSAAKPNWSLRFGFILIPISHSAGMNIITLLAFRFLTDNLAISAGAAGIMFALVKIYDGLLDPALGAWSDNARTRWGRRLPFLFAGGILMPLGIAMVFNTPDFGSVIAAQIFVTIALMLHASAYTALTIPSIAMLVEGSDDYNERTTLMAYRVFGNSLGVVIGSTLPAVLLGYWGATRTGHAWMSLVVAGITLVGGMAGIWLLRNAPRTQPEDGPRKRYSFVDQAKLAWANRPFRILAIAHIFVLFGTAITSIGSAYFSKYVLLLPDGWLGTYYMIATVGSVGSMPIWVRVSKRMGKKWAYIAAMTMFGALHLAWFTALPGEADWLLFLRAITIGMSSGGVILCAYSMMSDAMRYDYIQTGLRREGAFAGFTTLFDKLSAAAGIAIMGAFLSGMGYVASTTGTVQQPPSAIMAIYICLAVVPALAMVCAILALTRYDLDESMLVEPA
ncbi:MFS transporter [Sphingobium sp. HWE2-09]|uniref:MFS transporter n=1 Tax=Sphingobium sp. HWE2-09 TaxID=3108390 RepID=UPI002DC0C349|nr:MFS transporter [Sphingobium sp. HWE2-09]